MSLGTSLCLIIFVVLLDPHYTLLSGPTASRPLLKKSTDYIAHSDMRGGRGGKGGKGGRGGRGSMTQDLLRDNLEDLGIENPYNFAHDTGPPLLYPPISLQAPCTVRDKDIYYIQKMREIRDRSVHMSCLDLDAITNSIFSRDLCLNLIRFKASPYFLTQKTSEKDIERYSDKLRR